MINNMFIPKKIKVGFRKRDHTYTKLLAYVIYFDEKGKLRKEKSWEGWRDKSISPVEYDNSPISGFVLNKSVGGYSYRWGDFRQSYVRVYDPRGFEFEITIPNLLYILEYTSSIKGKGLEGEFIYAWDGTELVLLPISSPDYIELEQLNEKRFENRYIKAKDLKIGAQYLTKDNKKYVYMGKFDAYQNGYIFDGMWFQTYRQMEKYATEKGKNIHTTECSSMWPYHHFQKSTYTYDVGNAGKQHFFCLLNGSSVSFIHLPSIAGKLIDVISDSPISNYTELFEKMEHDPSYSPYDKSKDIVRLLTQNELDERITKIENGCYHYFLTQKDNSVISYLICTSGDGYIVSRLSTHSPADFGFEVKADNPLKMIPTSLENILEKMPPYAIDTYLANGKFYRSVYY